MTVQVRLIAESDGGRRKAWCHAVEQEPAREVDPAARHVLVRADPELPAEHPDKVGRVRVQHVRRIPEGHPLAEAGVYQLAELMRDIGTRHGGPRLPRPAKVTPELLGDERQADFGLELLARLLEHAVQLADAMPQHRVTQQGLPGCRAGQARGQLGQVEVHDPLAKAGGRSGPSVMGNVRWQQRDRLAQGTVLVAVQVVPDDSAVNDQQRPRFVRVLFTADLFTTGNDRDNRAAVRAVPRQNLDLVGIAVYGPRGAVDKVVKGAHMHP